jgi:hypothetical protein
VGGGARGGGRRKRRRRARARVVSWARYKLLSSHLLRGQCYLSVLLSFFLADHRWLLSVGGSRRALPLTRPSPSRPTRLSLSLSLSLDLPRRLTSSGKRLLRKEEDTLLVGLLYCYVRGRQGYRTFQDGSRRLKNTIQFNE